MDRSVVLRPAAPAPAPVDDRADAAPRLPLRLLAAAAAGLLLYGSLDPLAWWPLAPVGVAVLVLACRGLRAGSGALVGLVAGLLLFVPLLRWSGLEVGPVPWLLLALLQASFFAPLGAALAVLTRLPGWALWTAAAWVAEEALRGRLPFGGFPWGRLAHAMPDTPFTPLAAVGGLPLLTAAVALVGGLLALAVVGRGLWPRLAVVPVVVGLVGGAALAAPAVPDDAERVDVAVVQGNVPRLGLDFNAQRAAVLDNHVTATRELADDVRAGRVDPPDLVVWPENSSDIDPFTDSSAYAVIDEAVRDIGVPVLIGAVLDGPGRNVSNAGIVWDPETGPGERYVKRHPVPFGEYIPLRGLARRISSQVDLVPRDFARGEEVGVLDVGPARIGDVICFEVAYDGLVRDAVREGGRLLVVQTNNATFGRSPQTEQQLAMSRLRAVEHGRAVVVAATSGVSAVVQPDGELSHRTEVFTRDVSVTSVPLLDDRTLATRLGVLPEAALALLAVGALVVAARREAAA
ncbi:MAG: apolipoprotein N-acyltransferase [Actinomycetes bacterium]